MTTSVHFEQTLRGQHFRQLLDVHVASRDHELAHTGRIDGLLALLLELK